MQAFAPLWCHTHTHQCQPVKPFFSTQILVLALLCSGAPYATFSYPVWCTSWKPADRGKVKCWGCLEFYPHCLQSQYQCEAGLDFLIFIHCEKSTFFKLRFSLPQTCLDHGQTKPILVVLRLLSTPTEQNMSVRPCPRRIDYSWLSHLRVQLMSVAGCMQCSHNLRQCSVTWSTTTVHCRVNQWMVNVRVIMVCPRKDSWTDLVTLSLPRSCYYCSSGAKLH